MKLGLMLGYSGAELDVRINLGTAVIQLAGRTPANAAMAIATLDKIRKESTERMLAGVEPSREIRSHGAYEGLHRRRQIDIAIQLFQAMGIERDDAERRHCG